MRARPRHTTRRRAFCLLAVAAGIALATAGDVPRALATAFAPTLEITLADPSPGAASDVTYHINIPAPSAMLQSLVSFTPAEFTVVPDADVPDGAIAGRIDADTRFGLVNGACDSAVDVSFDLMEAATDPNESFPAYLGVDDYNGNGLPDNVDYSPSFLNTITPGITPVQRLYGQVLVAGVLSPINLVFFEPGARLPLLPELDAALGYPTLTFINDPVAPVGQNALSDFCTPLDVTAVLSGLSNDNPATPTNEAAHTLRTNPAAAGNYGAALLARSRWDADNDGIENNLDPCPLIPDAGWDPRDPASPFDADGDGLPLACDPNDSPLAAGTNSDQDGDGYLNRQDNCPLAVNNYPVDTDIDGIGDACDPFPGDASDGGVSHRHDVCLVAAVPIGGATGDPPPIACPAGPDLPMPAALSVYPDEGYRAVGSAHSMSASLRRRGTWAPIAGATVSFAVSGANPATGACATDDSGGCEFAYSGANAGTDEIAATAVVDGVSSVASATIEWVGPPPNDAFAQAMEVGALPFTDAGVFIAATTEPGEPADCGGAGNTAWYVFTAPGDMPVRMLASTLFQSALAVYQGESLGTLTLVACSDPDTVPLGIDHGTVAGLLVHLQGGSTYHIRAGSRWGYAGYMHLRIEAVAPGDADCSGLVTSVDALSMLRVAAGLPAAAACLSVADVDCDGDVDSIDALRVLRIASIFGPGPPEPCSA